MWQSKALKSGRYCCENTRTHDTTDQSWATEEEATAWANATNEKFAAWKAKADADAKAKHEARLKKHADGPTDILTSRGDGWESSGK